MQHSLYDEFVARRAIIVVIVQSNNVAYRGKEVRVHMVTTVVSPCSHAKHPARLRRAAAAPVALRRKRPEVEPSLASARENEAPFVFVGFSALCFRAHAAASTTYARILSGCTFSSAGHDGEFVKAVELCRGAVSCESNGHCAHESSPFEG